MNETVSNRRVWGGRILTALAVAFLVFDGAIKVMQLDLVADSFEQLGYPARLALAIGTIELLCVAVYVLPSTSVLGAILLTGYLGGAIATHVRIDSPLLTHTIFPIYVAVLIWGGLFLRDPRVRTLASGMRPHFGNRVRLQPDRTQET